MNREEERRQKEATDETAKQDTPSLEQAQDQAVSLFTAGRLDEAESLCQQIMQADPDRPVILHLLGVISQQTGENEIAANLISRSLAIKPDYVEAILSLGGVHQNSGDLDEAVACYRKALSIKPDFTEVHFNLGCTLKELGKFDEAASSLRRFLDIFPGYAEAHHNLGIVRQKQGLLDEAAAEFLEVIAVNPDSAEAYNNLATVYQELGLLDDSDENFRKAISINPDYATAHNNLGYTLHRQGRLEEATGSYQKALSIDPDFASGHAHFGQHMLMMEDFQQGWEHYGWRNLLPKNDQAISHLEIPFWEGQSLDGKNLLLWGEQGIGDTVLYAGMIPDLMKRNVKIQMHCDPRLVALFSRSFPKIDFVPKEQKKRISIKDDEFDFMSPIGNLGQWMRPDEASFETSLPGRDSYLLADPEQTRRLRARYKADQDNFLVGIAWRSKRGKQKSMTLNDLKPVFEIPGLTFVDLQYGDTEQQRQEFENSTDIKIIHDDGVDQMEDIDLFAAQTAAMDIVVTISNTTAHMAGGLGVPTLLMLSHIPIWYWFLNRRDSPWYRTLKLFRQTTLDDWQDVISLVENEVRLRAASR